MGVSAVRPVTRGRRFPAANTSASVGTPLNDAIELSPTPVGSHVTMRDDQLARAYPQAAAFAGTKRDVDRDLLFRNQFWDGYLAKL